MLVLVDEMTKQRSLGYAERAFMGEDRTGQVRNLNKKQVKNKTPL
jgi:hypothetical protein